MIIHTEFLFTHDNRASTETPTGLETSLCLVRRTVMSWLQTHLGAQSILKFYL